MRTRKTLQRLDLPREPVTSFSIEAAGAVVGITALAWLLARYNGTPIILIILAVLILVYTFVLNRTVFCRHIYEL